MIWTVRNKSEHANRAVAEIRKARACINGWDMY